MRITVDSEFFSRSRCPMASVSLESLITTFCEAIEVAVHCILHARGVYPAALFYMQQYNGVGVASCRHPRLRDYVGRSMDGIRDLLLSGNLDAVIISVQRPEGVPVERYVWRIRESAELVTTRRDNSELPSAELCRYVHTPLDKNSIRQESRAMLSRLVSFMAGLAAPLSDKCKLVCVTLFDNSDLVDCR
jgi:hypothetical protein